MPDLPPPPPHEVEIVVVHAPRLAPLGGEAAFSALQIEAEALKATPRLDEALKRAPGVSLFRRTGSGAANPTTQGISLRSIAPSGAGRTLVQLASPILSFLLFVGVVSAVYRYVPSERVPARAFLRPAILVGVALAGFTQLFTFIAPRMMGFAALFGTFVAVFALLAWMSISFNVLLLGASWTRVRAVAQAQPDAPPALDEPETEPETDPV